MATFNITTAVNIDSLSGKAGSDTYNINGGYLTVDQHTRYGTNQSTSATMGNITISATLGGTIEFNSTLVRLIAYDTGSGTVPAYDTVISQGSASGKLLGVYASLAVAPTAVAAAMPASGFILIRQWNSVAYTTGALTGISASATAADRAGFLEIVAQDALRCTANRLGTFKVRGDWFELGVTDGVRATTYQVPMNGAALWCGGCWVETGIGTDVYEFYPSAGTVPALSTSVATDEVRGRWCWTESASSLLRFGHDGTNSTGGFIPPAGRKVRIPNIFFPCTNTGTTNTAPSSVLGTRYEFLTTGGGVIDIDKASMNWYFNFSQAYSISLTNVSTITTILAAEIGSPIAWSHVGVGMEGNNVAVAALQLSLSFAGGTMNNCTWTRPALTASNHYVKTCTSISGFTFTNERVHSLQGTRGSASTGAASLTRVANCTFNSCLSGGGRNLLTTCTNLVFNDQIYYDHPAFTTITSIPQYAFDLFSSCADIKIDGMSFGGLTLVQPYNGILNVGAAGCTRIKLRNLGEYSTPLDLGDVRQDIVSWTRVTTTATVTKTNHGLKTGDTVYVPVSSVTAAIPVGSKTLTGVPTENTFTFACTNSGATSGTLSYFPTKCANLFVLATGAAANDIEVKRCYTPHTRTNLYTADNSSKNIKLENVYSDFLNAFTMPQLNGTFRAVTGTPTLAAQTSVYGTHWWGNFIADVTPNISGISWTRSSTTATITSAGHGLRTGLLLNVLISSDTAAIVLGKKSVTVIDADTFTFTCLNAGATSGTITINTFVSRLGLMMNEATAETVNQYTIDLGTPGFTSTGRLYMPVIGDQITFQHPDYVIGHTEFQITEVVMAGGTLTNYDLTYAIDFNDGSGFGSFKNLSYCRTGGGGSSASTNVTMTSTTGVAIGDYVFGTNIAPFAKVQSITDGTTIVVSSGNIGTVSGILRFNALPNESASINAELGFKLKVRIATTVTNALSITSLYMFTDSTVISRGYEYPLDLITLTVTPLTAGSEVRAYDYTTGDEYDGVESSTGTSAELSVPPDTPLNIVVLCYDPPKIPVRFENVSFDVSQILNPNQLADRNFNNP